MNLTIAILDFGIRLQVRWLWTVKKCLPRCEKLKKSNPIWIFLWLTKMSEAVCKRDWQDVRLYLFFNVRTFRTKISDSVCNECVLAVFVHIQHIIIQIHSLFYFIFQIPINNISFLKPSRSQLLGCVTSLRPRPLPQYFLLTLAFTLDPPWVSCEQSTIVCDTEAGVDTNVS